MYATRGHRRCSSRNSLSIAEQRSLRGRQTRSFAPPSDHAAPESGACTPQGDPVEVTLADGVVADFVVTSVAMYPKDQFPSQQVYGSHGNSALQLVTCGGTFDSLTRSYLSNIVVYTSLQAMIPPGGSR